MTRRASTFVLALTVLFTTGLTVYIIQLAVLSYRQQVAQELINNGCLYVPHSQHVMKGWRTTGGISLVFKQRIGDSDYYCPDKRAPNEPQLDTGRAP